MLEHPGWKRLLWAPERVCGLDVATGVFFAVGGMLMVAFGQEDPHVHPPLGATLAVLTMTAPLIWRRQWPVTVALVLAAGATINCLGFGSLVRCGTCLPPLLLTAYSLGRHDRGRQWWPVGLLALVGSTVLQATHDPELSPPLLPALIPMLCLLLFAGWFVASRGRLTERLEEGNEALLRERAQVRATALEADRTRIAGDLEEWLGTAIKDIECAARHGLEDLEHGAAPLTVRSELIAIAESGRSTLQRLRHVVGSLLETDAPAPPALGHVEQLLARTGDGSSHLTVEGAPRLLEAGIELSGYRAIEHLLSGVTPSRRGAVEVTIEYGADALCLTVRGPGGSGPAATAVALASARVELLRGTLTSAPQGNHWVARARVPLLSDA